LTFCEVWPPDNFPLTYYRYPTAPDWQISIEDFDLDVIGAVPLLYATATGLAQSPSRETTLEAMRVHRGITIFDLDHRPMLWEDPLDYGVQARLAAALANVVVGNETEVEHASGGEELRLAAAGGSLIVKRGPHGARVLSDGASTDVPGTGVRTVNGLGAGDAFAACLGCELLRGLPIAEAARRASVAGAIVASRMACSEAMPFRSELDAVLAHERRADAPDAPERS
jgi:5-dehydro-2-deoxygluconokinase